MQRAVNPATGETLFLVDNKWVAPTQVAKNDAGESAFLINNQWITPPAPVVDSKPSILAGTTLPADAPPMGNRMISEIGRDPLPITRELPKFDVSKMPIQSSTSTKVADIGKSALAGLTTGSFGAPEAIEAGGQEAAKSTTFLPTEALSYVSDPRKLANQLTGALGFGQQFKEQSIVPNTLDQKQRLALDETLAKGKIPQFRQLTELGNSLSDQIKESISPQTKKAMAESQPTGNIIKALQTGDFSEISIGNDPNALGMIGHVANVFGTAAPSFLIAAVSKNPTVVGAAGFGQAGSEAINEARDHIKKMNDQELAKNSPYFANLLALGYTPKDARLMTESKAGDTAAMYQGLVGALGNQFTSKLLHGGFDKLLLNSAKSRLGQVATGTALAGVEGGTSELAEGVAADLGINKTVVREIGVDSFANLVLGAIGEAAPGAARGFVSKTQPQTAREEEGKPVLQKGKNVTVEGAPPTPPAPPAGTPPAGQQDLGKFKALEDQDIEEQDKERIDRLDALEAEFKTIDEKYKTATPAEFGDLNRRQGEITKEMNELIAGYVNPPTEAAAPKAPEAAQREAEMKMDVDKYGKPKLEEALSSNGRIFIDSRDEAGKKTYYAKGVGSIDNKYAVPLDLTSEEKKAARLAEGDLDLAETTEERDAAKKQLEDVLRPAAERAVGKTPVAETTTTVAPPKTPEETKPPRKIIPQEFTPEEIAFVGQVVGSGNGLQYNDEVKPVLKKFEKAGLLNIKNNKVYVSQEAEAAGIRGGDSFVRFTDSPDMDRVRKFVGYNLPVPKLTTAETKPAEPVNREAVDLLKKRFERNIPINVVSSNDGKDFYASGQRIRDQRYLIKLDLTPAEFKKAEEIQEEMMDYMPDSDERADLKDKLSTHLTPAAKRAIGLVEEEKPKTKAEINKERQAKQREAAEKTPIRLADASKEVATKFANKVFKESKGKEAEISNYFINANEKTSQEIKDLEHTIAELLRNDYLDDSIKKKLKAIERYSLAKEVHIEGKKEEPVTSKTIEESMDKAASKVDYAKIKTAVKNQFDQAIKRATIQTDKEWDSSTKDDKSYVTIDIPGDGTFKIKNNVERLKEMQSKVANAVVPKVAKEPSGPSSGSIEAFKGMVDDKDMENAIEYAKLKGLDPKTVKLTPAQRSTVDKYLKNPAEFERQAAVETEEPSDRELAAGREKLAREEERNEEARFKAVIDTTIRSTPAQLKGDIAKRNITSMDAKRMLEAFPNYPEGVVKPYTVKQLQKLAGPTEKGVPRLEGTVDEDGFKVTAPMLVELNNRGYEMLHIDNPKTYKDKSGELHRTMEKDGVRVAFDGSSTLFLHNGRVNTARGGEKDLIFYNLQVDPEKRKQGLAKQALADITEIAKENNLRVYLEPVQLEKNGMTKQQLSKLYSDFGFKPKNKSGSIMVLKPEETTVNVKDEDNGKPGSFVDSIVKDFAEKAQKDFLIGDDVRVGNTPGTVVGLEGDYIKFRPISATNLKAYQRVQKKNVEFVSRPNEGLTSSASKEEAEKYGVEPGNLNADLAGLVQLMGGNMYAANLAEVTIKELLQNSFDAVKGAVSSLKEPSLYKSGHITIELNEQNRTIKITDDARGMTTDIVKNALFTIAGSDKSDLAPEDRSGGLGVAKLGFMVAAEKFKVDTVRDGVRTVVDTTGENIARSNFDIKKSPAPKSEHGTTIEVKIPEYSIDPKTGDKINIWFPYDPKNIETLKNPLIGPVEVKLMSDTFPDKEPKILPFGINFNEEATPKLTKVDFDWGYADVYFGVQRQQYPKHQILSSGVYQFNGPNKYSNHFMLNQSEKIPYDIIVNVKPKVEAKHPNYPFENSRESFKSRISNDIDALGAFLARVARGEEAKDLKESFEGIVSMPRVEVGEDVAEVSKKLKKVFDQRGQGTEETKVPEMPKEIVIKDSVISDRQGRVIYDKAKEEEKKKASTFQADKEAPTRDQFMIDMKQDPKLPIFHNNTNVDFIEIGRQYGDPEKFFAELGTLMVEMKEELAKSGIYKYDILNPENLFFGGVSIDKGYGGVHIKVPYKAVFLNPFYGWGAKSLFGVRQNFLNTMIHEIAHTGDMDHGVGHNGQMIKVEQYLADQGLLDYYRDAILDILARHESTFTAMKEAYERSTTANIAKSLEDINKGAKSARGDDSGRGDKVSQLSARTGQGRNEPVRPDSEDAEEEYDRRQEYLAQREADGREDFKLKTSKSVKDMLLGSYGAAREAAKAVKESPMLAVNKMASKLDRAITYARIKGVWYGRGLEVAEVKKFNGQVKDGQERAIATVALTNALHSGEIMSQVIMRGKLMFDTESQMFRAEDAKESLANVMLAKHDLIERVGAQEANNMIQDYFEAKRSRSILNAFQKQEGIVEKAKEKAEKIEFGTDAYYDALDEVEKAKNDFYNIAVARSKVKLSDESIDIYSALEDDNPELRNMMDNWQAVNSNNLDNMEFSGLISKKRAKSLHEIEDYVPWQRIQDEMEDVHSAPIRGSTKSLTNVAKEKVFKRNAAVNKAAREYIDGEIDLDQFNEAIQLYQEDLGEIDDILDNMLHNTAVLGRNSMRNHAANMIAARYAERYTEGKKAGKLKLYREEGRDDNGVRLNIVVNGRRVIVNIPDPLIAEAVIGMENINMPAVEIFAVMANLLRRGITTWPQFQLRQLFMDAPTAAMVSGLGAKNSAILYADTFKSFLNALNSEDPIVRHLKAYGIGGFQSYTRSPEQQYKQQIGLIEQKKLDQFTNLLDKIGDASDMAQRIATYKRVLAETGDETLALIRSNNIIDFKKHGNAKIVVALTRSVSFMNAYAQQLDVLAEALAGGGLKGKNRGAAFASMLKVAAMLTMWTTIYTWIMGGNDDYEKMDDQKKARNFVIPKNLAKYIGVDDNILLPMNTSAAYFFKAMPELITNYVIKKGTKNEVDGTRLRKALAEAAIDSLLGPNPIATGVKPFVEIGLNRNFFTGGAITPKGLENLDAAEQYNASTSELGKVLSAVAGGVLNPIEMDHLVRGIFGTNGAVVMWGSNMLSGERPTAEQKDNPLWGGLMDRDVGRGPESLFYDLKSEVEPKHKTFMKLIEREKDKEADDYFKKHEKEIAAYEYVTGIESALKEINKEIRRVGEVRDPKFSKDDRRKEIQGLQNTKNDILSDVIQIRKEAGL